MAVEVLQGQICEASETRQPLDWDVIAFLLAQTRSTELPELQQSLEERVSDKAKGGIFEKRRGSQQPDTVPDVGSVLRISFRW